MPFPRFLRPRLTGVDANGQTHGLRDGLAFAPVIHILSRSQCTFARIKLPAATRKGRDAAKLMAARNQHYSNARLRLEPDTPSGLSASIWSWDNARTISHGGAEKSLASLRVLPETLARIPLSNGVRLVSCIEGYEGEMWSEDILMASRWWPAPPSLRDWQLFLRAAKMPAPQQASQQASQQTPQQQAPQVPTPVRVAWREDLPVIDRDPQTLGVTFSPLRVAIATATFAFALLTFQLGQQLSHSARINSIEAKLETVAADNREAYAARARALTASASVAQKSQTADPLAAIRVLTSVTSELSADLGFFGGMSFSNGTFEAGMRNVEQADIAAIAAGLEAKENIENVSIEQPNAVTLVIKGSVVPVAWAQPAQQTGRSGQEASSAVSGDPAPENQSPSEGR